MKQYAIGITSLLACIGANGLQADVSDAQMRSLENRVSALEQKKSATSTLNPSGRPQVRDGLDLFFTADWLIWQAHENGLSYAVKAQAGLPPETALYKSSVKNMEFDWDFGFRLGLGYNLPHDGWDLYANWTWFEDKASQTTSVGSSHALLPISAYPPANEDTMGFRSAHAKWRLHLNMIDLDLGREFFVSKWMTLRPFVGLRTAWVRQHQSVTFTKALSESDQTGALLKGTNNYWGIGPRTGLNTQWGLGSGFSLFGNMGCSLLYGFFQVDTYQNQLLSGGAHNDAVSNTDSNRVGRVITEVALGLRWDTMFMDDGFHFGIQGGWEQLMFFGQNQFKTLLNTAGGFVANQGDLTIQGWTLAIRLDF
jgi:hypothetical protein